MWFLHEKLVRCHPSKQIGEISRLTINRNQTTIRLKARHLSKVWEQIKCVNTS